MSPPPGETDLLTEKILALFQGLDDEKKRDVLKYHFLFDHGTFLLSIGLDPNGGLGLKPVGKTGFVHFTFCQSKHSGYGFCFR